MKKRIPILTIFIVALVALGYILYTPETKVLATDSDGFAAEVDKCPTVASSLNNGCPKDSVTPGGIDEDGDGFFAGFVKDASTQDVNDNDPCIPNKNCGTCDYDNDGITLEQELANKTNPESDDTDKDGLKDKEDSCPIQYGLKESQGCELEFNTQLQRNGKEFLYNPALLNYCQAELVFVDWLSGKEVKRSGPLEPEEAGEYYYSDRSLKKGFNYIVYFEITSGVKGVKFANTRIDKISL